VRTANETEQARKVYKKGDKLSVSLVSKPSLRRKTHLGPPQFPIPVTSAINNARPANHDAYGAPVASTSAAGSRNAATATVVGEVLVPFTRNRGERRDANDYWSPCAYCTAPRSHEAPDRYVCEEPVRTREDGSCCAALNLLDRLPREHIGPIMAALLVIRFVRSGTSTRRQSVKLMEFALTTVPSFSGELGPESIAQTCSGCGEGVCGLVSRFGHHIGEPY
jgi:hypothetical protein